jgi:hypothetical protein
MVADGFDLLPQIKRIDTVKLYRPATGEPDAWPELAPALTRPIRWERIAEQYDLTSGVSGWGSACVRGSQTMPMSFGWIWGQEE